MGESPPTGTVTFLLTDVEGSTRLWDTVPTEMSRALARHDAIITAAVSAYGGELLKTRGEGDSTFSVFVDPSAAVMAAAEAQAALSAEDWPAGAKIQVRMAVHSGVAEFREGDYFGVTVNRAARIRAIGHGGQLLISDETVGAGLRLQEGIWLRDLGLHRLRDLSRPERLHQLGGAGVRTDFPPLRSLDNRPHNLPIQLTRFVGRDEELREVAKLLDDRRLLTLTGPGGSGKTRLALQVAADVANEFADGVWLVELAALADGELVAAVVAAALGSREEPGRALVDTLVDDLRRKRLLLLLDNCEHLVSSAATLTETILRSCPDVVVLATSRQPLSVQGEALWPVAPLPVPPDIAEPLAALADYESVRLFLDRAVLVRPGISVTEDDARHVVTICRRLDGIPLALELAAARVSVLSLAQLAGRLDHALGLLTSGSRTAPSRQQTLRATIDWSYDLLDEGGRELLDTLSVFPGRFTLDGAEAVAGSVLDALGDLVDRSLVVREEDGYRLLETVREYVAERLGSSGRRDAVAGRHLAWLGALPANDIDLDNARAALTWALTEGADPTAGAALALTLADRWERQGPWTEGRSWLLIGARGAASDSVRADCLYEAGALALKQGDVNATEELTEQCLALEGRTMRMAVRLANLASRRGDQTEARAILTEALAGDDGVEPHWTAVAVNGLGNLAAAQGDFLEARQLFERALAQARNLQDASIIGRVLLNLASTMKHLGQPDVARTALEESIDVARVIDDKPTIASVLAKLAELAASEGDNDSATELYSGALALQEQVGDRLGRALSLYGLADAQQARGDLNSAFANMSTSLVELEAIGHSHGAAAVRLGLGSIAVARGDLATAQAELKEALSRLGALGDQHGIIVAIEQVAELCLKTAEQERACALLAAADQMRAASSNAPSAAEWAKLDARTDACRRALGERFDEIWKQGSEMGQAEAVALATK